MTDCTLSVSTNLWAWAQWSGLSCRNDTGEHASGCICWQVCHAACNTHLSVYASISLRVWVTSRSSQSHARPHVIIYRPIVMRMALPPIIGHVAVFLCCWSICIVNRLSPGQYLMLNIPWISHTQWHPFSVMPETRPNGSRGARWAWSYTLLLNMWTPFVHYKVYFVHCLAACMFTVRRSLSKHSHETSNSLIVIRVNE